MTSVGGLRLDEPEVRGLGPHAVAALAIGSWHCAVNLTDGVLTPRALAGLGISYAARKKLVDAGLWKERDGGAIEVVDYLEYNPSRADVEARREKASQRMKRVRSHVRANTIPESPPVRANTPANDTPNERENSGVGSPTPPPAIPSGSGSSPDPEGSPALTSSDPWGLTGSARDSGKRASRGARRRSTDEPIPEGFPSPEVLDALLVYGRKKGLRDGQIRDEIEGLVLWAKAGNEKKSDWIAAAQGWLRRHANGSAPGSPRPPNGNASLPGFQAPYHAPADTSQREPGLAPAEALQAIAKAKAVVLGRTMP